MRCADGGGWCRGVGWLGDEGSNLDLQIQSLPSYRLDDLPKNPAVKIGEISGCRERRGWANGGEGKGDWREMGGA